MGFYEMGCACSDKPNATSGAESNLVKSEKLLKQAAAMRKQADAEQAKGNWTRASALKDQATEYERQANALPTLPKTKARVNAATKKKEAAWIAKLPGVGVAVGIAATLGLVGYAASKKRV